MPYARRAAEMSGLFLTPRRPSHWQRTQFWSGSWEHQQYLAVPTARGGKASPSEAVLDEELDLDPDSDEASASKIKKK